VLHVLNVKKQGLDEIEKIKWKQTTRMPNVVACSLGKEKSGRNSYKN
jgi:hypothetical protein